jgi:SPP1 gp7 family putative phage head morphogenesis protein
VEAKDRTQKYWRARFEAQAARYYRQGDRSLGELKTLFKGSAREFEKEIQAFYAKYGVMQQSPTFKTLSDGTKVISGTTTKLVVPIDKAYVKLATGTRISKLESKLQAILMQLSKDQNDYMKVTLGRIAEGAYYDTIFEAYKGYGVGTSFDLLNPTVVNQLIKNPVNGQDFSKRIWNNRDKLANTVNQTLRAGITQGISNGEMAKRLSRDMNMGYNVAERLIQTEVTNTYNQATLEAYKRADLAKKYEFVASLDDRTSDICTDLDGKLFDIEEATVGLNYPPMHPNCRSTTVAHFDDSREFLTRRARDVETGKTFTVPASMTAKDYKAIYVDKTMTRAQWDKS